MTNMVTCNYAMQCRDKTSGKFGSFMFDVDRWAKTGELHAVGPVFTDLAELFANTPESELQHRIKVHREP